MAMSTHVVGFRPPDDQWRRMKNIRDACVAAGVSIPEEVDRFFDGDEPDPAGLEIDLTRPANGAVATEWSNDYSDGYEVDLQRLPPGITTIRVYNSY